MVLHGLGRGGQAGIERGVVGVLLHDLFAFFDDADNGVTGLAASRLCLPSKISSRRSTRPLRFLTVLFEKPLPDPRGQRSTYCMSVAGKQPKH
jgi:hypothetical protein